MGILVLCIMHKNVSAHYTWQNILFEKMMKEHFLKLMKEIDMQVQEAQRVPNKRPTLRHIIIKKTKVKDKESILKAATE